ncbi:hypothetical protein E5288_WYG006087 [Bos mutus]|uniref:Uncharacterized protein n=1 Tax=Bos mutus TaxID=72004 RepID=A0A6B0QVP5_9CETA|nr:hypothetical protein [Bos mutus]
MLMILTENSIIPTEEARAANGSFYPEFESNPSEIKQSKSVVKSSVLALVLPCAISYRDHADTEKLLSSLTLFSPPSERSEASPFNLNRKRTSS